MMSSSQSTSCLAKIVLMSSCPCSFHKKINHNILMTYSSTLICINIIYQFSHDLIIKWHRTASSLIPPTRLFLLQKRQQNGPTQKWPFPQRQKRSGAKKTRPTLWKIRRKKRAKLSRDLWRLEIFQNHVTAWGTFTGEP